MVFISEFTVQSAICGKQAEFKKLLLKTFFSPGQWWSVTK